jgi:hypothetical protein
VLKCNFGRSSQKGFPRYVEVARDGIRTWGKGNNGGLIQLLAAIAFESQLLLKYENRADHETGMTILCVLSETWEKGRSNSFDPLIQTKRHDMTSHQVRSRRTTSHHITSQHRMHAYMHTCIRAYVHKTKQKTSTWTQQDSNHRWGFRHDSSWRLLTPPSKLAFALNHNFNIFKLSST